MNTVHRLIALLALLQALGCSTTLPPLPDDLADDPAAASLSESVHQIVDGGWNPGRFSAARARAEELGLGERGHDEWIDWFTVQRNLVITIPGTGDGIGYVVAHYDKADANPLKLASGLLNGAIDELVGWSYLGQGAYDNGSGVALALELARDLAARSPQLTWRILLTGAEESGLRGARAHVARLSTEEWERIRFAINLDTLGRDDRPNCVMNDASDPALAVEALDVAREYDIPLELGRMPPGTSGDHVPFARTSFWRDFGRGVYFNLIGGFLPQRSWFTRSHGTPVLAFSSCDAADWSDLVSGTVLLPVGRIHGPRDRASKLAPERLVDQFHLLQRLTTKLDSRP